MDNLNSRGQTLKLVLVIALILGGTVLLFGTMFYYLGQLNQQVRQQVQRHFPAQPPDVHAPPDKVKPTPPASKNIAVDLTVPANLPPAARDAARRVLPIRTGFANGGYAFGNAFLVNDRLAVTSGHLLNHGDGLALVSVQVVCGPQAAPTPAQPLVGSQVTDVAFLRVACRSNPARFRLNPRADEKAWINGLDYSFETMTAKRWIRSGRLNPSLDAVKNAAPCFQPQVIEQLRRHVALFAQAGYRKPQAIGTPVYPGNSGSLVHDSRGRVLGMVFGASCNGYGFYIPSVNLLTLAKRGRLETKGGIRERSR